MRAPFLDTGALLFCAFQAGRLHQGKGKGKRKGRKKTETTHPTVTV
jgi:hypothetical protein